MIQKVLAGVFVLSIGISVYQTYWLYEFGKNIRSSNVFDQKWKVWAAHRGGSKEYLEQTKGAFSRIRDIQIAFVEVDLRITKDLEVVLLHDSTLDRIIEDLPEHLSGLDISEIEWTQIKDLKLRKDLVTDSPYEIEDEGIQRLEDYMADHGTHFNTILELKEQLTPELEEQLVQKTHEQVQQTIARKSIAKHKVFIFSFKQDLLHHPTFENYSKVGGWYEQLTYPIAMHFGLFPWVQDPKVRVMFLPNSDFLFQNSEYKDILNLAVQIYDLCFISNPFSYQVLDAIKMFVNMPLLRMTVNTEEEFENTVSGGWQGALTDYPRYAIYSKFNDRFDQNEFDAQKEEMKKREASGQEPKTIQDLFNMTKEEKKVDEEAGTYTENKEEEVEEEVKVEEEADTPEEESNESTKTNFKSKDTSEPTHESDETQNSDD